MLHQIHHCCSAISYPDFFNFVAAILIFKMSDKQRTILEVIFRILILKNMGIDTKITLLSALEVIHGKNLLHHFEKSCNETDDPRLVIVECNFCILGIRMNILI